MNGSVQCLRVPKGLDAERVAVLTIDVINLKVLYCRSRKSKNILRKACQILLSDDDIRWGAKNYRNAASQTVFFLGTYHDFVAQACSSPTEKTNRHVQTVERALPSPPTTADKPVQTLRRSSWSSKCVQTDEPKVVNASVQVSHRISRRRPTHHHEPPNGKISHQSKATHEKKHRLSGDSVSTTITHATELKDNSQQSDAAGVMNEDPTQTSSSGCLQAEISERNTEVHTCTFKSLKDAHLVFPDSSVQIPDDLYVKMLKKMDTPLNSVRRDYGKSRSSSVEDGTETTTRIPKDPRQRLLVSTAIYYKEANDLNPSELKVSLVMDPERLQKLSERAAKKAKRPRKIDFFLTDQSNLNFPDVAESDGDVVNVLEMNDYDPNGSDTVASNAKRLDRLLEPVMGSFESNQEYTPRSPDVALSDAKLSLDFVGESREESSTFFDAPFQHPVESVLNSSETINSSHVNSENLKVSIPIDDETRETAKESTEILNMIGPENNSQLCVSKEDSDSASKPNEEISVGTIPPEHSSLSHENNETAENTLLSPGLQSKGAECLEVPSLVGTEQFHERNSKADELSSLPTDTKTLSHESPATTKRPIKKKPIDIPLYSANCGLHLDPRVLKFILHRLAEMPTDAKRRCVREEEAIWSSDGPISNQSLETLKSKDDVPAEPHLPISNSETNEIPPTYK